MGQVCMSPGSMPVAPAAGKPAINTVAVPGPVMTPVWLVKSLIRAAGGMDDPLKSKLINFNKTCINFALAPAIYVCRHGRANIDRGSCVNIYGGRF